MDLTGQLNELEQVRDWQGLAALLEQAIKQSDDAETQSALFLRLGRVMAEKLLQGPRALKSFQNAWKLKPENVEPLFEARKVYWELGKFKMVDTVLRRSLEAASGDVRSAMLVELGDVNQDLSNVESAQGYLEQAVQEGGTLADEAAARLVDLQVDEGNFQDRIDALIAEAVDADAAEGVTLLLRAARVAFRFDAAQYEDLLLNAYQTDPRDRQAASLYEELLVADNRLQQVVEAQRRMLESPDATPALAFRFGERWITRHQNAEIGATLLSQAVLNDPELDAAFTVLRDLWATHEGDPARVVGLVEQVDEMHETPSYLLAEAGRLCWREVGDLIQARRWFERLAASEPNHPHIGAFEAQIGEAITPAGGHAEVQVDEGDAEAVVDVDGGEDVVVDDGEAVVDVDDGADVVVDDGEAVVDVDDGADVVVDDGEDAVVEDDGDEAAGDGADVAGEADADADAATEEPAAEADADDDVADEDAGDAADEADDDAADEADDDAEDEDAEDTADDEGGAEEASAEELLAEPAEPAEPAEQDDELIAKLLEEAEEQQSARRNHDYVKTLVALAEAHVGTEDKISYYSQAAEVYQKFSNASEASKCFEEIIKLDPTHAEAREYLQTYYEKRRDWESLIGLLQSEADMFEEPDLRLAKYVEIAELATKRIKKPPICIEMWSKVRALDPQNVEALDNLANFYERSRDWEELSSVLQEQVPLIFEDKDRLKALEKLAQIQGDRLKDDEAAAETWRQILELNPGDRRAQENLKKRLLSLRRWDDLELLYEESGKWDEFIRLLESQESREKDPETKVSMLLKAAELWISKKDKADRASRAYEKILKIDENHLGAAEQLIPIYEEAGNAKGLADAIEVKLQHLEGEEALPLLQQVAELYENRLRKPDIALERYLTALNAAPHEPQTAEDVERVAQSTGKWDKAVEGYTKALEGLGDPVAESTLRLRLGRVYLDETEEVDKALEQYRAVYELDPENTDALQALERLYRQTERFQELLEVYEKQRDLATDPEQQCRVLYGIAELYVGELEDKANAIQTYWQVLDVEPADGKALEALDGLYLAQEQWEPYADVLRRRLETDVDEETLADLKYRLGKTLEQHLGDPAGALENYREILFINPSDERARVALEGLLENDELQAEVARILSEVYEGHDQWEKLVGALEILVKHEDEASERVGLLRKVAMVAAEHLEDVERAFDAQSRALADMPESEEVRLELEDFAERGEAYAKLAEVYAKVALELTDPDLARSYWMRLAAIQQHLEQVDEAAGSFQKVLEIDPADSEALDAMEQLFASTNRWDDLIGVIRRRIELADDFETRERLYANMANIYDEQLEKPEEAIAAYNEVLAFDDASMRALRALDDLYGRQGMHQELSENLEQQLRLAETEEEEIQLMVRLARLQEGELEQVEAAIETYRQVLDRNPQSEDAIGALERLGQKPEFELEIADVLGPLYRQAGDYEKLLGVYEVQVRRSEDPMRAVELLHEMSELHEDAAGDLHAAFDTLARALALDPATRITQEGLERLAAATERFADLAKVYEELAAKQEDDVDLAISLYSTSARIYEMQLAIENEQYLENAIAHYRKILELDPQQLDAVESLERIFRGADRYQELSAVLQQRSALLLDVDDQKNALMQAATIEEEALERPEQAVAVYLKVLEVDPEDIAALDALIRLYMGMEKWTELLQVYNTKVDLIFDADERKRIYYQMGAVHETELGQVREAIDTYQRVLEIDPDDLTALGRLDVLYQQAEDWPELLTILQREADLAADPAESISYQYRIAELYDKRLDDVHRAIELYRDLLMQMSDHEPTLEALEALTKGERAPLEAALVLEPMYDALSEWNKLIEVLEVQVRATDDPYHQVELLHRIARTYEEMLSDPASAFDVYARAVRFDMANEESLMQYERLASMVDRWGDLATLYDEQLAKLKEEDPIRYVEIALRLARIYEEQLESFDKAIERYQLVLEQEPDNQSAISSLDRLFQYTERWAELAEILTKEAELAPTGDEILEFRFRLAQVQHFQLNDIESAIDAYGEVIREMPEHDGALQALEGLFNEGTHQPRVAQILEPHYEILGQFEQLTTIYEAVLAHKEDRLDRLQQYYRLAELHEERLLAPDASLAVYIRALQEYPDDERTLEDVERLAAMVEDGWEHAANAYADTLGMHEVPAIQARIGKRLARVFEEELGDVEKAEETFRYVLSVAPLDVDCLENLDRIYSALEQYAELAGVLEQRVQTIEETYALVELYTRLGRIYEEQLAQYDDGVRVYRKIFDELEPENEEAQQALERIYTHQENWEALRGLYDKQLEMYEGDFEQADISAKKARVLSDFLGEVERAIDVWKRVLDLRGEDGEALAALSELYERTEQWAELTEVLERHLAMVIDDQEHVQVLLRRARLYLQHLSRDDAALDDYNRVLDIDYENLEALYAINEIWRNREDRDELLFALHQTVDRAVHALPAEHQVALYREIALLHQQNEDQQFEAIDAWRKLLEVDPRDFDAMAHLEELLRSDERWEEVVDVKMMRAKAFEDEREQVREFLEVAHIWEHQVGNHDGAVPALDAVMALEEDHDDAFEQLEKLHKAAERWDNLVELYLTRIESREETGEQTKLLRKIAKIFDEKQDDQEQAHESLFTAFELDFYDEDTIAYLEQITAQTKKWGALIQVVNEWLENSEDKYSQIQLSLLLAKWYGEHLDRQDYALPYYQKVQELDPNNVGVLRQMASFYKKNGRWREQGQYLEKALQVASKDSDRAAIQNDIGEVLEQHVDPAQGLQRYKRALEADAYYVPALENLERIYGEQNMISDLVEVLGAKSKGLDDEDQAAEVKLRMGDLLETQLQQPERAIEVYREVLDVQAGNLQAIKGLERMYQLTENWPELLEVLEMHLDVVQTERERADVLLQVANLHESQFFKYDQAAIRLEQVVEIDPVNQPAFEALARCYQRLRQWMDLINALERHIQATDERQKQIELFTQIAETYADQLEDQERALDAYLNITDRDENHVPALEALARLYERMDDPANAIEYMTRVAELTVDGGQKVEAYYRIGKQLEDKLGDRYLARERFEQAIDLDPTHTPTLAALRAIAIDESDWDMATRYLDMEQQNTETPRARAKLLVELGRLRAEMLEEPELAVEAYELAHQADPDNEEAALPLARAYIDAERWAEAEPLTDMLMDRAGKREREEQFDLFMLHGFVEQKLEKHQEALQAYADAHKLDLTNQKAIRGLADTNFALGDWAGALTNYQKVLTSLDDDDVDERVDVYYRLGCVKREQGQAKQAINNYEKGLALDDAHRPTLEALVDIYEKSNDYAQGCAYRQQILDTVIDGEERYVLLMDLADTWSEKVKDPHQALFAYEQAAELKPDDHPLLHKMLQLYQKTDQWDRMVEILQKIAETDPKPERRARYLFTMAQVYRDKLEEPYTAADLFDEALDLNPTYLDAFKRIDKLFTKLKDWGKLERAYRKMIHRIVGKGNQELEYNLWHALGLIYRDRIGDTEKAVDAFTAATAIKPDSTEDLLILAELAEHQGNYDQAIGSYRSLLQRDPMNIDAYRAMYNAYLTKQTYDEAWCVAQVLAFLNRASPEEKQFFDDWRPTDIPKVGGTLAEPDWDSLFHEEEDSRIGKIFGAVAMAALKAKIEALKAKNQLPVLPEQFRQDPQSSTVAFAQTFWWARQVLGIRITPQLYTRSDVGGGMAAVPADPPASIAGQGVLQGLSPLDRAFVSGKHLAMYRPEHYIKTLFPTVTELTVILFAAMRIVAPNTPAPKEYTTQVQATAQSLARFLGAMERESLKVEVNRFLKEGARANIKRWAQSVETTASRAGLLLSGDIEVAKRIISSERQIPGDLTPQDRLKELMLFMVSEEHFALRRKIGVQIQPE